MPCTSNKRFPEKNEFKLTIKSHPNNLEVDQMLSVKDDQGLESVIYLERINEQGLSNPDSNRVNDNSPHHNCSKGGRNLSRSEWERK